MQSINKLICREKQYCHIFGLTQDPARVFGSYEYRCGDECVIFIAGIWLAKVCQPFTLLLSGFVITSLTGVGLVVLAASHPLALWILTALFGVMLAIANPAVVSWSNTQLPSKCHI